MITQNNLSVMWAELHCYISKDMFTVIIFDKKVNTEIPYRMILISESTSQYGGLPIYKSK